MKRILIKSIPYALSILWGIILAFASVYWIKNPDVSDLINNIAASLLAIPIVFLVYNYSEYKTSSKLNNTLTKNLVFDINSIMLKLLMLFRHSLSVHTPLSWESIQKLLNRHADDIKSKLVLSKEDISDLKTDKEDLNEHVSKSTKNTLLSSEQILVLSELVKALSHVINEREYRNSKTALAEYVEHVLSLMDDWFNTGDVNDLLSHEHFRAAMAQSGKSKKSK